MDTDYENRIVAPEYAPEDLIFVGGSTFVVADLLSMPEFR